MIYSHERMATILSRARGGGELQYKKRWGCSSSRLGVEISDFGIAWGVEENSLIF